jgi:hypothetical protein
MAMVAYFSPSAHLGRFERICSNISSTSSEACPSRFGLLVVFQLRGGAGGVPDERVRDAKPSAYFIALDPLCR